MREVVLDTETTGLDPAEGHRIVEIGCVELRNLVPTGRTYQTYLNPERDMPPQAFAVHGLSESFLAGHPVFAAVVDDLLGFLGDGRLVIHNAEFDLRFLNAELGRLGRPAVPPSSALDTLQLARRKHPGAPASLDALCRRYGVDTSERGQHGALLDARLLAEVYLHLKGGRQPSLVLAGPGPVAPAQSPARPPRTPRPARPHAPSEAEAAAHAAFIDALTKPIWRR